MGTEDSVKGLAAGVPGRGKLTSNIVCEFVCFMVDLLFGYSKDLVKVTLNGRFHSTVTLDGLQMSCAQDDQRGSGQDYRQLQNQHHAGSRVSWAFRFHPVLLIRTLPGSARYKDSSTEQSRCQTGVKRGKKL